MESLAIKTSQALQEVGQAINEKMSESFINYITGFKKNSPKTVETYQRAIKQFIKYLALVGERLPDSNTVIAYRTALEETCKPATVQNYIIALKQFFQWTEQEGLYPNIAQNIKGAKLTKEHKKDYLTSSQVKAILEAVERDTIQGRRDYAILTLMITGGLRDIEVSRAKIEDLRTLGDTTVLYIQGKGKEEKADFVKVPPEVERAIRLSLADRPSAEAKDPLFISLSNNSKGQGLTTRSISGTVKQRLRKAGYDSERLTAHSLRHTAVTLSLLAGDSLQEVQQFARHSNIATTQIYAHNLDKMSNPCGGSIASAIF